MATDEANVKDKSTDPELSQEYLDFLRDLRAKSGIDISDRTNWKNKMIVAANQRLGVRRYSLFPYAGAPNIPLPETDKIIKKSLPSLVLSAISPKKIARVAVKQGIEDTDELRAKAKKAELALNMYFRSPEMNWFKKLMLAADNRKQYGHCIFKVYEKFICRRIHKVIDLSEFGELELEMFKALPKNEKSAFIAEKYELDLEESRDKSTVDDVLKQISSGEDVIEFDVYDYSSMPMVDIVDPTAITVPSYTQDINDSNRIREEYFLPRHRLEQLMDDGIFIEKDMDDKNIPCYTAGQDDLLNITKARNEGVSDNTSRTDLYRMEMISCWYREKKGDQFKRKIFTFFADVSDPELALVQDIDFPFEFEGWMYEKDDNETKDTRYFSSRGEPEMIRAMQEIMERSINNKIIRDEMSNTPMWEVLDTSQIMSAHIRMNPGAKLPVRQLGAEIKQLSDYPRPDPNSTEIMSLLKAYTEEYRPINDQFFRNQTNAGGGKTLGEIQTGIQQNAGPLNLDVTSWNETLSRVYQKVFYILQERFGDSIQIKGETITKDDFDFPAEVRSNGDLEMANEQMATQKAAMRLQVLLNPALQDIVNSEDRYNALKDWLEKDGVKDPDLFCTDPKIIAQEQITQMQGQLQQMQQQAMGMQEEMKNQTKQTQSAKTAEQEAKAKAQGSMEMSEELDQRSGERIGEEIGNELFAGSPSAG